ncbi:MAG: SDR family NAD(P)-dependent oxidoreductase [Pseudomonadota bacterium]
MFTAKPEDGAVWITGASEGIGKALAKKLADEGFEVYVSARSEDKLNDFETTYAGPGKIMSAVLDVTDREACSKCVDRIIAESGRLAICVLNAGTFKPVTGKNLNFESFDTTINVNLNGVINCMLPAVEAMKSAGQGQISFVSSVAGYGGLPKNASYGISKAGLINLAESLKFDFDKMNIKTQLINPGFIDTPLTEKNDFPMPFLMPVGEAANRISQGLKSNKFEITFPKKLSYILKFINLLPYPLYFWLSKTGTGSK